MKKARFWVVLGPFLGKKLSFRNFLIFLGLVSGNYGFGSYTCQYKHYKKL